MSQCASCGHTLPPATFSTRVRCDFCGADTVVDALVGQATRQESSGDNVSRVRAVIRNPDPQRVLDEVARRLSVALGRSVAVDAPPAAGPAPRSASFLEEDAGGAAPKRVAAVRASVGEYRLELQILGGRLSGRRARIVKGSPVDPIVVDDRNLAATLAGDLSALGDSVLKRFLDA